ncbi:uncharacterized protein ACA1_091510 [Acanthamoeba castellanii str. Neff]|uniref:Uncharacterized protein n=1 Tax=Acanthamoeba castellanii (strain ATCC 30010 / Neff) TaxID=1257118 RepID=L8GKD9_ACACF|nr:uncharacterized protein ACA1_091510 [Acanthamoeba castellanii str. Neff]ELR12641.1 hypothetical protein ACA1_091510 [Acanthamoeba castellanii str. Neff]
MDLAGLQEEHRRAVHRYRELLEGIDAEVKLQHHLRLEAELFGRERESLLAQQADQDRSLASLREVLAHWTRQKAEAQVQVEQLCSRENRKRERLEARAKALAECIEAERRQATEVEEAHDRLVGAELAGHLDAVLRREVQVRAKFEAKLGHSIELLKKNAARASAPSPRPSPQRPRRAAAPATTTATTSTSTDGGAEGADETTKKSHEMDQNV